ncbi:MAG: hypothetical protein RBS07_13550 [Lentimicrobium sp.]|jgi:hypothetical protein|nr:hypothetical protein [Lentimicrobium sp.]
MDKSFTPQNFSNVTFDVNHQPETKTKVNSSGEKQPSESVIQHLLNYSRALVVIESKLTGTKSVLLLN